MSVVFFIACNPSKKITGKEIYQESRGNDMVYFIKNGDNRIVITYLIQNFPAQLKKTHVVNIEQTKKNFIILKNETGHNITLYTSKDEHVDTDAANSYQVIGIAKLTYSRGVTLEEARNNAFR
ncbi:MAG: hypothetical protein J5I59_08085 [Saprospiraceae bacterium]|nr:hypothetical protein [Saprospiraceae bacterium]